MKIKWLGHASFLIEAENGIKIVTDPFDESVGYKIPNIEADIVTVSHSHYDHNAIDNVKGNFKIVDKEGKTEIKGINILGLNSWHDELKGMKRGKNIIFVIEVDGIKVCHLGDLGHMISKDLVPNVNVLLIPVGGFFTIDSTTAKGIIDLIKPNLVIPMHYKTKVMGASFPIDTVEPFIKLFDNVEKVNSNFIELEKDKLPKATLIKILDFE